MWPQPTWLTSTIKLVRRLLEAVNAMSGLRNRVMAHLRKKALGTPTAAGSTAKFVAPFLPDLCFGMIARDWVECFRRRVVGIGTRPDQPRRSGHSQKPLRSGRPHPTWLNSIVSIVSMVEVVKLTMNLVDRAMTHLPR